MAIFVVSILSAVLLAGSIGLGLAAHELEPKPPPKELGSFTVFPKSSHNGNIVGWLYGLDGKPIAGADVDLRTTNYSPDPLDLETTQESTNSGRDGRFVFALGKALFLKAHTARARDQDFSKSLLRADVFVDDFDFRRDAQQAPDGLVGRACFQVDFTAKNGFLAPEVSIRFEKRLEPMGAESQTLSESQILVSAGTGSQILDVDEGVFARLIYGSPQIFDSRGCEIHFFAPTQTRYGAPTGTIEVALTTGAVLTFQVPKFTGHVSPLVKGTLSFGTSDYIPYRPGDTHVEQAPQGSQQAPQSPGQPPDGSYFGPGGSQQDPQGDPQAPLRRQPGPQDSNY